MAKVSFEVEAQPRTVVGKGASRRLRREELIPGVVYGGGKETVMMTFQHKLIAKALANEAFYSHILTLKNGTDTERVILKDVQRHPYKPRILHLDFQRVRADEKLYINVPLHFVNADKAPGVRDGGNVSHIESDAEVACLPDDLPEFLEVDLSNMQLNDILHLSDIKLPKGVELVDLTHENDKAIVSIHLPREEEVIPTEAPVASEVPAMAQKSDAEIAAESEGKDKK